MVKRIIYRGGRIFDGTRMLDGQRLVIEDGILAAIEADDGTAPEGEVIDLNGSIVGPGFVDLQVNGGGGVMFNDDPSVETLTVIADAHRTLGTVGLLPTLITDTPQKTQAAIQAVHQAIAQSVPGILGLHLEGPHLSKVKKGAHDADLIRPMTETDLELLIEAANGLPNLMVTLAPESATPAQVSKLAEAGVLVSLGHTNADFETCQTYFEAGAICATHLFNAMSQMESRHPGLVGAALANQSVAAGIIADGIHVHPAMLSLAMRTKPGRMFLVTDAMATAGSAITQFALGGRTIRRQNNKLTLEDGTLAGADLDMKTAVGVMVESGIDQATALAAATVTPASLLRTPFGCGPLAIGKPCELIVY